MFLKAELHLTQMISRRKNTAFEEFNDDSLSFSSGSSKSAHSTSDLSPEGESVRISTLKSSRVHSKYSTACSSTSSLYSCGSVNTPPIYFSLSTAQPASLDSKIICWPPIQTKNTTSDRKSWQLVPSQDILSSSTNYQNLDTEQNQVTSFCVPGQLSSKQTVAMTPRDEDHIVAPCLKNLERSLEDGHSPNVTNDVELLVQETDQAFQAVGNILADIKNPAEYWCDIAVEGTQTDTLPLVDSEIQRSLALPSESANIRAKPSSSTRKMIFQRRRIDMASNTRSNNDAIEHRRKRWAEVTNNFVEAISEKMFRTDVDEILSPSKLEKLKHEIRAKGTSMILEKSIEKAEASPKELFNPESLSGCGSIPTNSADPASPLIPDYDSLPPPIPPKSAARAARNLLGSSKVEKKLLDENVCSPSLPPKDMNCQSYASRTTPTITNKHQYINANPAHRKAINSTRPSLPKKSTLSELVLPSTPYSLTSPLFRHGPIVIVRSRFKQEDISGDESLNWTAFQIAIAGTTTVDELCEFEKVARYSDETELDEIANWWEDFGLGLGELVHEKQEPSKKSEAMMMGTCSQQIAVREVSTDSGLRDNATESRFRSGSRSSSQSPSPQIRATVHSIVPWDIF